MNDKVIVTGGTGLLGSSLERFLRGIEYIDEEFDFVFVSSSDYDLTKPNETERMMNENSPDYVIHLAAVVGGIQDNVERPYDFMSKNLHLNTNIIDSCVEHRVPILCASSTCVYPSVVDSYPMTEDMVEWGTPEKTNASYAYAKRIMAQTLVAANKQHDLQSILFYISNLYGENDHFDDEKRSHLVTALIKKFHDAKESGKKSITLLGTGKPLRQFVYAEDIAHAIYRVLFSHKHGWLKWEAQQYNLATHENLSVKQIASIVKKVVGYTGKVRYNGKLDGVFRKDVSCDKLLDAIGNFEFTPLVDGVTKTYESFLESVTCGN